MPFDCSICFDEKPPEPKPIDIAGDPVCSHCYADEIVPKFHAALKSEHQNPVRWGSTELQPGAGFSTAFKLLWEAKRREYRTAPADRLYCKHVSVALAKPRRAITPQQASLLGTEQKRECLRYLGRKSKDGKAQRLACLSCHGVTCNACGLQLYSSQHSCDPSHAASGPEGLEGLIRGKDFQLCPNKTCNTPIALEDGCNAILCEKCHTWLCFICGEEADHDSDHWGEGKPCPRWNQPDAENAHFDAEVTVAEIRADLVGNIAFPHAPFQPLHRTDEAFDMIRGHIDDLNDEMDDSPEGKLRLMDMDYLASVVQEIIEIRDAWEDGSGPEPPAWHWPLKDLCNYISLNLDLYVLHWPQMQETPFQTKVDILNETHALMSIAKA